MLEIVGCSFRSTLLNLNRTAKSNVQKIPCQPGQLRRREIAMQSTSIRPLKPEFEFVTEGGIDERKRISLAKALVELKQRLTGLADEALQFRIYINAAGQILLDPAISVPARELWLYRNPVTLAKVREGLAQAKEGRGRELGSFARHANDKID